MLKQIHHLIFITLFSTLLVACGGGGSGDSAENNSGKNDENVLQLEGSDLYFEPKNISDGARIAVRSIDPPNDWPYETSGIWYANLINPETTGDIEFYWRSNAPKTRFAGRGCIYTLDHSSGGCSGIDGNIEVITQKIDWDVNVNVTDANGLVKQGNISFYVKDLPPVARLIIPYVDVLGNIAVNQKISIDGGTSYDPQSGIIKDYTFLLENKPVGSMATLMLVDKSNGYFDADIPGDYVVSLFVKDEVGQRSSVVRKTIKVVAAGQENKLYAEVNVGSPIINKNLSNKVYDKYPYSVVSSETITVEEKVGSKITLNGIVDTTSQLTWQYTIRSKPAGSNAEITCLQGPPCSESNVTFTPDKRGGYLISALVQQGSTQSKKALIKINATLEKESALPMLGDIIKYNHEDQCVSAELSAPWAGDVDGSISFAWRVVSYPAGGESYVLSGSPESASRGNHTSRQSYFAPDDSLRAIMVGARVPGHYTIELMARERAYYSKPHYLNIEISNTDIIDIKCTVDTDNDGINDFHDDTPNGNPDDVVVPNSSGSYGGISSCTSGSACTGFYVNRIIYGF